MAIKKVESSMVWAIDYDPKARMLEVAFLLTHWRKPTHRVGRR
jgi:hypothetical protein